MVDIKRGSEWDYAVIDRRSPGYVDTETAQRRAAKKARMEGSRVKRPASIPEVGQPRSSFAVFEAQNAMAIAQRRLRNTPRTFDIDASSYDPKYSTRSTPARYPGYGGK